MQSFTLCLSGTEEKQQKINTFLSPRGKGAFSLPPPTPPSTYRTGLCVKHGVADLVKSPAVPETAQSPSAPGISDPDHNPESPNFPAPSPRKHWDAMEPLKLLHVPQITEDSLTPRARCCSTLPEWKGNNSGLYFQNCSIWWRADVRHSQNFRSKSPGSWPFATSIHLRSHSSFRSITAGSKCLHPTRLSSSTTAVIHLNKSLYI